MSKVEIGPKQKVLAQEEKKMKARRARNQPKAEVGFLSPDNSCACFFRCRLFDFIYTYARQAFIQ